MELIDAYAEARHIGGCHTYNAKTAEARASVIAALTLATAQWPKDAAEVREFFNSDFISAQFAAPDQSPCDEDRYYISAHDFLSAVNWWADFPNYESQKGHKA
jgi:hypothetical protein